jgi:NADH-quinone oxidoreductase subunit N
MTLTSISLLMPLVILAGAILIVMLTIAFYRRHIFIASLTLVGITLSGLSIWFAWRAVPASVTPLLKVDHLGLLLMGILLFATFVIAFVSYFYLNKHAVQREEYYLLLLLAALGGSILVVSNHFAAFFLGLEILTVSLYGLIGFLRDRKHSIEAAIKYLILASVSTAFLLFGIALIYANQGTLAFDRLDLVGSFDSGPHNILLLTGFGMLFVGIGFKLAVVPFHMWTPDVYQGAPAPVTGFIATVSKGAIFALLLRLSMASGFQESHTLALVLALIAMVSMLLGNLLALLQDNVKRILAYSSIAHLGYLLVAFLANSTMAIEAATFYLTAYIVTTLGAFVVVSVMSDSKRDAEKINDYRSLYWKRPWLATLFTLSLLSLIGMPLTAGFMGKFFVLTAGIGATLWLLAIVLVLGSAIGLYYYLRIVVAMFMPLDEEPVLARERLPQRLSSGFVFGLLMLILLWLGLYPTSFITMIQSAMASFG